jgi:uncharacterized protein (DUF362 family)
MNKLNTRRDFLKLTSAGIAGIGTVAGVGHDFASAADLTSVAIVRNEKSINDRNECKRAEAGRMIDRAITMLTGKGIAEDAWGAIGIRSDDIVGIKVNCNRSSFPLFAHTELVYALCESLGSIVPANNIIIYERRTSELEQAGFTANMSDSGIRCTGTDQVEDFDPTENVTRLVSETCTKIINLPSLKTIEGEFGGTLFLKNHVGTVPHKQMPQCHGNTRVLCEINARKSIRDKTVLALCDGLRGTYQPSTPWYWKGIIASRDVIAAEVTALSVINERRIADGISAIPIPTYVSTAASEFKLGTVNPAYIEQLTSTL